jgi:transcription initiation factor TFIIE subunit beta
MPSSVAGNLASSAPSPAPSNSSNHTGTKRKREAPIAPTIVGQKFEGKELLSQVQYAQQYLQSKNKEVSFKDILNYLSIQHSEQRALAQFRKVLQKHAEKVLYNPRGLGGVGSYKYKPVMAVENSDQLKGFLQGREDFTGVKFDDIKDGWPDSAGVIDQMEGNGELLVIRDRRKVIRTVWQDDPSLRKPIAENFKVAWHIIKLPANVDDLRAKLEEAGLKPTSAPREGVKAAPMIKKKKRVPKRSGRETNSHVNHLLKDFSHKRK